TAFNLKKTNHSILQELNNLINEQRKLLKQPEPVEREAPRFKGYNQLEFWDLSRWKRDAPALLPDTIWDQLTDKLGTGKNPSVLSNLRTEMRKEFPQFVSPPSAIAP